MRTPGAYIKATPLMLAERYLGVHERAGGQHNPIIQAWLQLAGGGLNGPEYDDETAWCSAFAYAFAYELDLHRPERPALRARAWLKVGEYVPIGSAIAGFDVVVMQRGIGPQPGPEVTDAPGHVGYFLRWADPDHVVVVGGNQDNAVTEKAFPLSRVLGVRRI